MPSKQQITWIKVGIFIAGLYPLFRLIFLGVTDHLTANPIEFVERSTGTWALVILMVTLSMTPIKLLAGIAWPIQFRRMMGLFMFFYACLHIVTYAWLDHSLVWVDIVKDIYKHPYVLVGFSAFVLSIPLAITSNKAMIKRLKGNWKKLHQAVYAIAILGVLHYWWLVKKDLTEPIIFAVVLAILLGIRIYYNYCKSMRNGKNTNMRVETIG
jgi:sulfoxide reductase heme-binding subunit YedZ